MHARLALDALAEIAAQSACEKTRLQAAEALLDRAYGKPAANRATAAPGGGALQPTVITVETGIRHGQATAEAIAAPAERDGLGTSIESAIGPSREG